MGLGTGIQRELGAARWNCRETRAHCRVCGAELRYERAWKSPVHRSIGGVVSIRLPNKFSCYNDPLFSVANATADLLMMGVWSIVLDSVQAEQIPVRD